MQVLQPTSIMDKPTPHAPSRVTARAFVAFAFLVLLGLGGALFLRSVRRAGEAVGAAAGAIGDVRLSERVVRERVQAALESEAEDAFLITGRLEVTATTEVSDTRTLLPWLAGGVDLGTTRATVRVPGTIHFGIDLTRLSARAIRVHEDGLVEVELPEPVVKAVEPHLEGMEIRTDVGWARLTARSGREAEHRAVQLVGETLREQGRAHLQSSHEARIASGRAVAGILAPVLRSAGFPEPRFVVTMPGLTVRVNPT